MSNLKGGDNVAQTAKKTDLTSTWRSRQALLSVAWMFQERSNVVASVSPDRGTDCNAEGSRKMLFVPLQAGEKV